VQVLAPVMGALRALVQAWGSWCQDPEWTDEPFVDEDEESVEVLVELLSKSEQELRLEAAAVLYHLCTHEYDLMVRAGSAGAVSVLVDVVKHNTQSSAVVWAVSALCVLVTHEPNQERFACVEGHVATVNLLQTTLHSEVAEQAARTLSNFMCCHKAQLQVAAAGAAQALVSLLTKCMRGELFQVEALMQQACAAICNLTFENDANRIKVGEVGGCAVLVRVCKLSPSYQVMEQACAAIGNICKKNRTNRSLMGMVGGCEMLLAVLSMSPPERTAVQVVRAIGNVAMRAPENQLKFAAGNGLRLLLQLIETLSLRLAPVDKAVAHDVSLSSTAQAPSHRTASGAGVHPVLAGAGGRNVTQHEESFLQLTLSALAALVGHECCRAQLASDTGTHELLQRIVRTAIWPETQAVAKRLIGALSLHPAVEATPAPAPAVRVDEAGQEQGGDATAQGLVDLLASRQDEAVKSQASEHAAARVGSKCMERGEWDPSDCEAGEDEVVDYHSDACSVTSYYSRTSRRSSTYSRGSSRSSRPGSMQSGSRRASALSHESEDDDELRSSATRSLHSSRTSFVSDAEGYDRNSCYTPLFSDASGTDTDDELDVEPPQIEKLDKTKERLGVATGAPWGDEGASAHHGAAAVDVGGDASTPHGQVRTWQRASVGASSGHGQQSPQDLQAESSPAQAGGVDTGAPASQGENAPSSVAQLIQKRELRLTIDSAAPAVGGGLAAIPMSPMSGDGLAGLPPVLRNAMQERHHPDDAEVCASRMWKQKQRVVDAWLEVAQVLQMHKVALQELQLQRSVRLWRQTFLAWRRWLDADDDEDEQDYPRDGADLNTEAEALDACNSEPSSPAAHAPARTINWDLMQRNVCNESLREFNRSASSLAERSRQSVCSEESFSCDTRSGPSLPLLPAGLAGKEAMGRSVDGMTVASEASTRSLGSEQSSMSWFEGAAHKSPADVPPSPGGRSAEAQLEASTRAMESLLNSDALGHPASEKAPAPSPSNPVSQAADAAVSCAAENAA
jgi:hypothetical protein